MGRTEDGYGTVSAMLWVQSTPDVKSGEWASQSSVTYVISRVGNLKSLSLAKPDCLGFPHFSIEQVAPKPYLRTGLLAIRPKPRATTLRRNVAVSAPRFYRMLGSLLGAYRKAAGLLRGGFEVFTCFRSLEHQSTVLGHMLYKY